MKLSLIIPCFNEEKGIPNLVSQLNPVLKDIEKKNTIELIFVDDGSRDNTYHLLDRYYGKRKNTKILRHDKNKNLGAALKTGFAAATGEIIVTIDSDCTYPPREIPAIISLLDKDTDIVTASPYHPKGHVANVPVYRLFLSKTVTKIYSCILGKKIYTYTALFRAYKRDVIKNIKTHSNTFIAVVELIAFAIKKGYKVKEYPTTLYAREFGTSKMKLFKTILAHLKFILYLITHKNA